MSDGAQPPVVMTTPGLHINEQAATVVAREIVQACGRASAILRGTFPPEAWPLVSLKGLGPETITFCASMAGLQQGHGAALGQPTASPDTIRARLGVVQALDPAIQAVTALLSHLRDVWGVNLGTANRAARDIYDRASVVANSNPAVDSAIDPIRSARGRAAKKAAMTRRRKKEDGAKKDPATS